jgi:hypothetical protein
MDMVVSAIACADPNPNGRAGKCLYAHRRLVPDGSVGLAPTKTRRSCGGQDLVPAGMAGGIAGKVHNR